MIENILSFFIIILQVYMIYMLIRIRVNVAKYIFVLSAFALIGCGGSALLPAIEVKGLVLSDILPSSRFTSIDIRIGQESVPIYAYAALLSLCGLTLYFVPIIDKSNAEIDVLQREIEMKIKEREESTSRPA